MRSTARQPRDDPAPEPAKADLDAKAVRVLDEHLAASAGIQALMARCPDPQSAALLRHALVLIADAGTHAEELRAQMKAYGQANESLEVAFQAGRDYERKLQDAKAAVPGPRHARGTARYRPGEGQRALRSVKAIPGFAAAVSSGLRDASAGLTASPPPSPPSLSPSLPGQVPTRPCSPVSPVPRPRQQHRHRTRPPRSRERPRSRLSPWPP